MTTVRDVIARALTSPALLTSATAHQDADAILSALAEAGFTVYTASDLYEALRLLRQQHDALLRVRLLVSESGGVPRYSIISGAALNSVVEEDLDPAIRAGNALLSRHSGGTA